MPGVGARRAGKDPGREGRGVQDEVQGGGRGQRRIDEVPGGEGGGSYGEAGEERHEGGVPVVQQLPQPASPQYPDGSPDPAYHHQLRAISRALGFKLYSYRVV